MQHSYTAHKPQIFTHSTKTGKRILYYTLKPAWRVELVSVMFDCIFTDTARDGRKIYMFM